MELSITPEQTILPIAMSSFIGREREVSHAKHLLCREDVRLLTLTGPGGIGKTRLALQIVANLSDQFPDGVFFVNLAPVSEHRLIIPTIAQTLLVKETADQLSLDLLKTALRKKRLLLILDNFEQVLHARSQVVELLMACANLKVMVTSRFVLHLSCEQEFVVPPLAVPDLRYFPDPAILSGYEAVALFLARVQKFRPDFELTSVNAKAIVEICARLDGLPLAIELAAARLKLFTPQALLTRLDQRLLILTNGGHDVPKRQQTLYNTVEWSYQLLDVREQGLFGRLAIFVGGCTLETAETVCAVHNSNAGRTSVLEGITSLLDKSLLQYRELKDAEPRLLMLETIREYGRSQLEASGELEAAHYAHVNYYLKLVEEIEPLLVGPEQALHLERLEQEHDNLRAALRWLLERGKKGEENERDREMALRFGVALVRFWMIRGYWREGQLYLEQALAINTTARTALYRKGLVAAANLAVCLEEKERIDALCQSLLEQVPQSEERTTTALAFSLLSELAWQRGELVVGRRLREESLALFKEAGNAEEIASSLAFLADLAFIQGEYTRALALFEESLAIDRHMGNTRGVTIALLGMARTLFFSQGDMTMLHSKLEENLTLNRKLGDRVGIALCLSLRAMVALQREDITTARSELEESLVLSIEMEKKQVTAWLLFVSGTIARKLGDYQTARARFEESLEVGSKIDHNLEIPFFLEGLASVLAAQGDPAKAAQLWGAAESLRENKVTPLPPVYRADYQRWVADAHTQLDEKTFAFAWAKGRTLTLKQIFAAQGQERDSLPEAPHLSATAHPHSLTRREAEVLRLVAQGLTNGEIAQRLVISPRTVDTHLTSIYSKLGVSSRSAATRYAIVHRLA